MVSTNATASNKRRSSSASSPKAFSAFHAPTRNSLTTSVMMNKYHIKRNVANYWYCCSVDGGGGGVYDLLLRHGKCTRHGAQGFVVERIRSWFGQRYGGTLSPGNGWTRLTGICFCVVARSVYDVARGAIVIHDYQRIAYMGFDVVGRNPAVHHHYLIVFAGSARAGTGLHAINLVYGFVGDDFIGYIHSRHTVVQMAHNPEGTDYYQQNNTNRRPKKGQVKARLFLSAQMQEKEHLDGHLQHREHKNRHNKRIFTKGFMDEQVIGHERKYQGQYEPNNIRRDGSVVGSNFGDAYFVTHTRNAIKYTTVKIKIQTISRKCQKRLSRVSLRTRWESSPRFHMNASVTPIHSSPNVMCSPCVPTSVKNEDSEALLCQVLPS